MTSLIQQIEMLDRQRCDLLEKIREEEERNKKLNNEASIERLEALIEPITQHLDWVHPNQNGVSYSGGSRSDLSTRRNLNSKFEVQCLNRGAGRSNTLQPPITKYHASHMLANEEIFVTLMGIIKKQDVRIAKLETIIQSKNNENKYDGESWNYA